jgi:hypothetical protein
MNGQPKLFGGSLEEYLDATNQEIPLVIKSCIRVINLYGKISNIIFITVFIVNPMFFAQDFTIKGSLECLARKWKLTILKTRSKGAKIHLLT